jgi:hypothetical protein
MNAPLVSCPFPVITFGRGQQQTHPKVMTGNGQLTRGAFIINYFLRNPHFRIILKVTHREFELRFFHIFKSNTKFRLIYEGAPRIDTALLVSNI